MNVKKQNDDFFKKFDHKYANLNAKLGIQYIEKEICVSLWQPIAKKVELLIFDKNDWDKKIATFDMTCEKFVWTTKISQNYDSFYYQFQITHDDESITLALDPYALSMAPFNWSGNEKKVGKAAFVNINSDKAGCKPINLNSSLDNSLDPYIYELHVRDFTSLKNQNKLKHRLGTFESLLEADIFKHLRDLSITHLQLLPIHSTYTVNELDSKIYLKGEGTKWTTNYNWGYDPHNYFTINGIYSLNPQDPYSRISEFRKFVNHAHKNKIGIILDVVYNHMMTNDIFNNILDGYYYRDNAKVVPVSQPPLADERLMVKKLIIDSLKHFVTEYGVDGFRFDLSCFMHAETLQEIAIELRKLNPNIILHGEAWPFSDLKYEESWIKGSATNNYNFAYFNDTLRNSIKGGENGIERGLIIENNEIFFKQYVSSIVGNLKTFDFQNFEHSDNDYDLFSDNLGMNLAYSHCHDGMTLWDKINTSSFNLSFQDRLERYRQGVLLSVATFGRQFMMAGTELLQSKPMDITGMDSDRGFPSNYLDELIDDPDLNQYHSNSYKTTDFVNGLKWHHLENEMVKQYIYYFVKDLNAFRKNTNFFKARNLLELKNKFSFIKVNSSTGIIIFQIKNNNETIIVAHNFESENYVMDFKFMNNFKILINTKLNNNLLAKKILAAHSSAIIKIGSNYETN
ncbi:hypothetical protein [Mycoplasma buteonis]|uniref:hypothetical protein n=1 Tax=Mycoplasma buteonis TaxID=171280 RepID=UPI00055C32CE|nr:hypothetical protein [Mycoplasma buteonis]